MEPGANETVSGEDPNLRALYQAGVPPDGRFIAMASGVISGGTTGPNQVVNLAQGLSVVPQHVEHSPFARVCIADAVILDYMSTGTWFQGGACFDKTSFNPNNKPMPLTILAPPSDVSVARCVQERFCLPKTFLSANPKLQLLGQATSPLLNSRPQSPNPNPKP